MAIPTNYGIHKDRNSMDGFSAYENGGKGSGNFGHSGRPGEVGGSAPSGSGGASGSSATKKKKYTKSDLINDEYKEGYITAGERDMLLKKAQEDGSATESAEPFKDKKSASGKAHSNKKSQESATEWAKKNFTSGETPTKDMNFDELLARMVDGEDYYELMGSDSVDREAMFSEMAKRTGLEYEDIYQAWMGDMGGQSRRYTDELKKSPRLRDLDRLNESGFQHWQKTGKQDLLLGTKEHDERNLRDMVRSTWTYGGGKDSKYLQDGYRSLSDKERKKIIDDEWKYLDDNCTTAYAGTDSEGGSYRSIKYRPSSKKKNNSLEDALTDVLDKLLNGGKGSGNFGHSGRPGEIGGSAPSGSHGGSSGKTKEEIQERIDELTQKISYAAQAQKDGEKVDESWIESMREERKQLREERDSAKGDSDDDDDENLPSSYTGKNVSLEYKAGDNEHRPTAMTTVPEDTGYGEFVELGDGKIGVKTTMSAEDTHDSIKALFETELAQHDSPRAKADGFLDKDLEMVVSDRTYDDFQDASKHLEDTAAMLGKYIKEVQGHSTSVHARGTKPGDITEKMRQATSLTDEWGKKLKSNPEMPKEALAKYQRRADTIAKSYETIKKIAERTPEYMMGMGSDSYRTHDVTADFDRPMTRAMAEREMKDMRAR